MALPSGLGDFSALQGEQLKGRVLLLKHCIQSREEKGGDHIKWTSLSCFIRPLKGDFLRGLGRCRKKVGFQRQVGKRHGVLLGASESNQMFVLFCACVFFLNSSYTEAQSGLKLGVYLIW